MKASHKGTIAAVCTAVVVFNFSSCKYPEGPKFTLKTKTARLTGEWEVQEIDGEGLDGVEYIFEFDKDGTGEISFDYAGYGGSYDFEWEWEDDKAAISVDIEDSDDTYEFEILRLTNDEMILEDEDKEEWELEKQ
ncbi:hypothetical protein GYB22_10970 [bacterium]|nr:hypothetical protein [bacterium]